MSIETLVRRARGLPAQEFLNFYHRNGVNPLSTMTLPSRGRAAARLTWMALFYEEHILSQYTGIKLQLRASAS